MPSTDTPSPGPVTPSTAPLDDQPVSVRTRLAAAWASLMVVYVYVDVIGFYKPGVVDGILAGKMWELDTTQALLTTVVLLQSVPALMIVLSAALPARAARTTNLVVAAVQVPYAAFNLAGETTWLPYYGLGVALELGLLAYVLRTARRWPRTQAAHHRTRGRVGTASRTARRCATAS